MIVRQRPGSESVRTWRGGEDGGEGDGWMGASGEIRLFLGGEDGGAARGRSVLLERAHKHTQVSQRVRVRLACAVSAAGS